jgi:hypothetical protein
VKVWAWTDPLVRCAASDPFDSEPDRAEGTVAVVEPTAETTRARSGGGAVEDRSGSLDADRAIIVSDTVWCFGLMLFIFLLFQRLVSKSKVEGRGGRIPNKSGSGFVDINNCLRPALLSSGTRGFHFNPEAAQDV